jgi:cytosine/adenosine deaminase-related metal-dependent hydrolase
MSLLLIRNAAIVSVDPDVGVLPSGDILVQDDRIAAIGAALDAPEGAEVIEAGEMIAMPGFVNAHIHTWQAGLRGIAVNWTLAQYFRAMHAGLATHFRPDDIRIANHVGALHQLNAGTTTLADWCHNNPTPDHTDAAIDGLEASGVRAVFLHGSPKPDPKPGQPHFSEIPMPRDEIVRLREGRLSSDAARVTLGLAVLGPQLSVAQVCDSDFRMAKEFGMVASMHVSGDMLTPDGFLQLAGAGLLGPHVNIVHGNSITDDDQLQFLIDHGVSFTPTPEVELQMGFGDPLTNRLRAMGGRISLGSDIESSMAGEMFTVTRFALQSARHRDTLSALAKDGRPPAEMMIPASEALGWATIEGARMLGMEDRIGSLTVGKQADIVLLDASRINMRPVHDPVASILFHAGTGNVDTVLVGGEIVKRGGELQAAGVDGLTNEVAESGRRIIADFETASGAA